MRRTPAVALAVIVTWTAPSLSHAIYAIPDCTPGHASPTTNSELNTDIVCDPSSGDLGITLNAGADLNMNGHTITCASGQVCNAAVTIANNNSVITGNGGSILGAFTYIVDCAAKSGSKVTGVKFDGYTVSGMYNCTSEISENVFIAEELSGQTAWQAVYNISGTPVIRDNYMEGFVLPIYFANVGTGGVTHNLVIGNGIAIKFSGSSSGTVSDNVLVGKETATNSLIYVLASDNATYTDNRCNPASGGCTACVTAGRCSITPTAPFSF